MTPDDGMSGLVCTTSSTGLYIAWRQAFYGSLGGVLKPSIDIIRGIVMTRTLYVERVSHFVVQIYELQDSVE
jgi:hypothetical protein